MILDIGRRFGVDLAKVPAVGDARRDLLAAKAAGAIPMLVRTGKGEQTLAEDELPDNTLVFTILPKPADYIHRPLLMKVARAFIFYLGIAAMALPTFLFIVLSWPLPLRWRWKIALLWAKFCRPWLRATVNLQFILEGREHLPPGPVIYICKHQSALETILLPGLLYPVVPVLKQELLWLPF